MARAHAPSVHRTVERQRDVGPAPEVGDVVPRPRRRDDPRRTGPLDHLMIGAPLTAAALGLLLGHGGTPADADHGGAEGASGTAPATGPAPSGHGAPTLRAAHQPSPSAMPVADGASGGAHAGAFAATRSGDEAASGSGGETAPAAGTSGTLEVADVASAAGAGMGGPIAGASVSITFGSVGDGAAGLDPGTGGEPLLDERGDIGKNVQAGSGDDVIHGTDGDDFLSGGDGNDEIHGHGGNDTIHGERGDDLLFGGAGDDLLSGGHGRDVIHGGDGDDDLLGGPGADSLYGEAGRDLLVGGTGDDLLDGGGGADRMIGGAGSDSLVMGSTHDVALEDVRSPDVGGTDTVRIGDAFTDSMPAGLAEEGATFILAGDVDQVLPEGTAAYQQQLDPDIENVHLTGSANHDVVGNDAANGITGNAGDNVLHGGGGQDILSGGGGADQLHGGAGSDLLRGGAGDDILNGGDGRDRLEGGDGDDILDGGRGADQLYGQGGNDTFILGLEDRAVDTIFDQEGVNQVVIAGGEAHEVQTAVAGSDLHIVVDHNPIAVIESYREQDFDGIDTGSGVVAADSLMVENGASGPALSSHSPMTLAATTGSDDLLASYLQNRSHVGADGADILSGTSGSDWLSGLDGNDLLRGGAGHDVLEGGAGTDLLEGGSGDDRYLFSSGHAGLDTIRDAEGSNHAELIGFAGAKVEGVMVGKDLWVLAHHAPIFKVENFAGNEGGFAGVHNGDVFIATEDLFT